MYAIEDFVTNGNIKELLYIRDYKCTELNLNDVGYLLKVLCTDWWMARPIVYLVYQFYKIKQWGFGSNIWNLTPPKNI